MKTKKSIKKTIRSAKKTEKPATGKKSALKKSSMAMPPGLVKRVLFRPERYEYVRQKIQTNGCVFCHASKVEEAFDSLCVYKSEYSMVVLNKFPYNSGHVLVLPRQHKGHLLSLSENEFEDLHRTLRKVVAATEKLYQPAALNIGLNHGKAAGAGLPDHLHYHVIPRWEGDLNFFPLIAETKAVVESLEKTYEKFSQYFLETST